MTRIPLRSGLILLPLLSSLCAQPPAPDRAAADKLQAEKKFKEAARAYEAWIQVHPEDPAGYQGAALCLVRLRRYSEATPKHLFALQLRPDDPAILFDLASSLQNQSRYGEAIVHWRRIESLSGAVERVATMPDIPFNRGYCAAKLDLIPEAVEAFNQALRIAGDGHPQQTRYRTELAAVLINAERFDEAAREFKALLAAAPSDARNHYHYGFCALQTGKDELAEKHLKEARRLDPSLFEASLRLGKLYSRQKKDDLAQSFYQEALDRNPLAYEGWHGLSRIAAQKEHPQEAEEYEKKYLEAKKKQDEADEKRRELRRRTATSPNDSSAWLDLALLALENNALEVAQDYLTHCVAINPRHEIAILNLAAILGKRGFYNESILELDKLLEADPGHPFGNFETARYQMLLGRNREAAESLSRGMDRMDPKDERFGTALDMLAENAVKARILPKMLGALETALGKLPPDNPSYLRASGRFAQGCLEANTPLRAIPYLESAVAKLQKDDPMRSPLFKTLSQLATAAGDAKLSQRYLEAMNGR